MRMRVEGCGTRGGMEGGGTREEGQGARGKEKKRKKRGRVAIGVSGEVLNLLPTGWTGIRVISLRIRAGGAARFPD